MATQTDLDTELQEAAGKCDDARIAVQSVFARPDVPVHHRELIRAAFRHVDTGADQMFKVAHLPRDKSARTPQLSMETL